MRVYTHTWKNKQYLQSSNTSKTKYKFKSSVNLLSDFNAWLITEEYNTNPDSEMYITIQFLFFFGFSFSLGKYITFLLKTICLFSELWLFECFRVNIDNRGLLSLLGLHLIRGKQHSIRIKNVSDHFNS